MDKQTTQENYVIKMSLKYILNVKSYVEMSVFRGMNSLAKFLLFRVFIILMNLIFNPGSYCHDFIPAILFQWMIHQGKLPLLNTHKEASRSGFQCHFQSVWVSNKYSYQFNAFT